MGLCERKPLTLHADVRGLLWEALHRHDLGIRGFGQLYVVIAHPGHARGNHYHLRKTESFMVIQGRARLQLWRCSSSVPPEREEVQLCCETPELVIVPPGICHRVLNDDLTDLILLAHSDEPFDPADPDTETPLYDFGEVI